MIGSPFNLSLLVLNLTISIFYAMKAKAFIFLCLLITSLGYASSKACDYAGSNLGFVKSQTELAIEAKDLQQARYHTYKALNAIVKSRTKLDECGCENANISIQDGLANLKNATKVSSLDGTRILLGRALENITGGLEALEEHEEVHQSVYSSDVLAMNTKSSEEERLRSIKPTGKELEDKIDLFLEDYRTSLDRVVKSLDCKEAQAYARKVFEHCEQQLLNADLTEAKKYYNLKTKEITAEALRELADCSK